MPLIFRCLGTNSVVEAVADHSIFLSKNVFQISNINTESISQVLDSLVGHATGLQLS